MEKYLILLAAVTRDEAGADCPKRFGKIGGKII